MRQWIGVAVMAGVLASTAADARAAEHPALLEREPGCEYWLGGAHGNDATIRFTVVLCVDAVTGAAKGHAQWSSLVSGWNLRELTGTVTADVYRLADLRLVESHPINGWHFCTIDTWDLRRSGDRLEGTYDSAACRDHASVWLDRIPDPASGSGTGSGSGTAGTGTGTGAGTNTASGSGSEPARDKGCCSGAPAPTAALATLVLLSAASRRRSAGGRRPRRRPGSGCAAETPRTRR